MQIYLDSANIEEIREANNLGVINGVTTNPTLVAKEGLNFQKLVVEICNIVDGPVSAEVVSSDSDGMIKEARDLAGLHGNIVIKIPMTGEGLKAVKALSFEEIATNVTLVFSANQALLAAKAGADYVSPFIGRMEDIGEDGMEVVGDCVQVFSQYGYPTEVIVASIRNPFHVTRAALLGADIATVPYNVLTKMLEHHLTDKGIERFLADWNRYLKKD